MSILQKILFLVNYPLNMGQLKLLVHACALHASTDSRFNISQGIEATEFTWIFLYQKVLSSDHHSDVDTGENS